MSNHGREDEFDDEVDPAAAAAQKEAFDNLRSWTSWGSLKREPKARTQRKGNENLSRFSGQWLGSDAPCVVKAECPVYTYDQPDRLIYAYIYGDKETTMKFDILGGSDAPEFALKLGHAPSGQTAEIHFMAWTRESPPEAAHRIVPDYASPPSTGKHTFSNHLIDVEWDKTIVFPNVVKEATKGWDFKGASFPLGVSWMVAEQPTSISLKPDMAKMPEATQAMFRTFYQIFKSARSINLMVRGHGALDESWRCFSSQPSPTPPPWWRYFEVMFRRQSVFI